MQQVEQQTVEGYGITPYDIRVEESVEFMWGHPWVALVFAVGFISCLVVAWRVMKTNPWVNEMFRMWGTR